MRYTLIVIVSLVISGFVFSMMRPDNYLAVAIFGLLAVLLVWFNKMGMRNNVESAPLSVWLPASILFAMVLGALWPASPVLLATWRSSDVDENEDP